MSNILILFAFLFGKAASDDLPAQWMSGKFGLGFRIDAGDWIERRQTNGQDWGLDWTKLVEQYEEVGASWVIVNLSQGAFGTTWMSYHPVLYEMNTPPDTSCVPGIGSTLGWDANCQTSPTPTNTTDYFKQMTDAFHDADIKVIAYVASQGPAMFKAGSDFAFDVKGRTVPIRDPCIETPKDDGPVACFDNPDECCSPTMGNWIKYVKEINGGEIDYPMMHTAYADVIIGYYAEKYKDDIDGWWFDHAQENDSCGSGSTCTKDFIDKTAVRNAIRAHQPDVPIAFNTCSNAQKSPLQVCAPFFEDFTAGHPKPLGGGDPTLPFDDPNYPMVTSIESTPDGFLEDSGWKALGHVFMPTGTAWNGPTIENVWTTPYPYTDLPYNWVDSSWGESVTEAGGWNSNATDWFQRSMIAKGAWTWNLPRESNSPNTYFLLHPNHLEVVKEATLPIVPTSPPTQFMDTFGVLGTSTTIFGGSIFEGGLQVIHDIGTNIHADGINGGVTVALYDYGCENEQDLSGLTVSLEADEFITDTFTYNVTVDDSLIGNVSSTFVNFTADEGNVIGESVGEILFCTRISTFTEEFFVAYYEFNFEILFNLTENEITFANITIEEQNVTEFDVEIEDGYGVEACRCDDSFACISDPDPIDAETQALDVCIYPTAEGGLDASDVFISNFNATLSNDAGVTFSPILFGNGEWVENIFTTVAVVNGTIRVSTIVFEAFFTSDTTELDVTGTAFLEFVSARTDSTEPFQLVVDLAGRDVQEDAKEGVALGCLLSLVRDALDLF